MIDVANLRARIGQEFEGECHLTAAEAHALFDVYEAACAMRDACRDDGRINVVEADRLHAVLLDAVDASRRAT